MMEKTQDTFSNSQRSPARTNVVKPTESSSSAELDISLESTQYFSEHVSRNQPPQEWEDLRFEELQTVVKRIQIANSQPPEPLLDYKQNKLSAETVAEIIKVQGIGFEHFSQALESYRQEENEEAALIKQREQIRAAVLTPKVQELMGLELSEKLFEDKLSKFAEPLIRSLEITKQVLERDPAKARLITNKDGSFEELFSSLDGKTIPIKELLIFKENVQSWQWKSSDLLSAPLIAFLRGSAHITHFFSNSSSSPNDDTMLNLTYQSPYFRPERSPTFQRIVDAAKDADLLVTGELSTKDQFLQKQRWYSFKLTFTHNAF